ncbi:MAG: CtsR family transcriptional regulator [Clostridia bacterium]|nr:CtsR family transcriptional regulator [Clostridia bacterium]
MSKISDMIECFILEQLEDMDYINLSRNELANFFNCAPSQINYVLSTRFTEPKGFLIESHRGGGGYIKLSRISVDGDSYISQLLVSTLREEIDYATALAIISNLHNLNFLDENSARVLEYALMPKALSMPVRLENRQRANILKNVLINILKDS